MAADLSPTWVLGFQVIEIAHVGEFDSVQVEAEIREGEWDTCDHHDIPVQSRLGKYIVIYKIL